MMLRACFVLEQEKFSFIEDVNRRVYHSMVHFLDDQLSVLVNAFKEKGMCVRHGFTVAMSDEGLTAQSDY